MTAFKAVRSRRAFEEVVAQIERAILDGHLKPGDRLPSERELTERFGVGRGTLREAFRVLEYSGLVTIKKGKAGGAFVSGRSSFMVGNSLKWLLRMKRITLRELAEFRERLEGGATCDAARKASRAHLRRLDEIVAELRETSRRRDLWPRTVELDLQFHQTVVEASGNVLSYAVECSIIDCMHEAFQAIPDDLGPRVLQDLSQILRLIRAGDAPAAEQAARRHIRYFARAIMAQAGARAAQEGPLEPDRTDRIGTGRSRPVSAAEDRRESSTMSPPIVQLDAEAVQSRQDRRTR